MDHDFKVGDIYIDRFNDRLTIIEIDENKVKYRWSINRSWSSETIEGLEGVMRYYKCKLVKYTRSPLYKALNS